MEPCWEPSLLVLVWVNSQMQLDYKYLSRYAKPAAVALVLTAKTSPFEYKNAFYSQFVLLGIWLPIAILLPESPCKSRRLLPTPFGSQLTLDRLAINAW